MIARESIETAYCFFHQKQRVYQYSTLEWQKEDIEYAISSFVEQMPAELYNLIAKGRRDYLCNHRCFGEQLEEAVKCLEGLLP